MTENNPGKDPWDKEGWLKGWLILQHIFRDAVVAVCTTGIFRLVELALDAIHLPPWKIYGEEYTAGEIIHYVDLLPLAIVLLLGLWNLIRFVLGSPNDH